MVRLLKNYFPSINKSKFANFTPDELQAARKLKTKKPRVPESIPSPDPFFQLSRRELRPLLDIERQRYEQLILARLAAYAYQHRRLCCIIALHIEHVLSSASWQLILEELSFRCIDINLVTIIASYLSRREIILEAEAGFYSESHPVEISFALPAKEEQHLMGVTECMEARRL
ncbi:hypothetical protein QE152_g6035 [Popillia japonica]|uniref:Uncharacterized protein n=1 Tax=Popillia japonica TaxID=7064 RepID=A0AAW1MKJ1_POPJA